jgi:hypothetical protein
MASIINATTSTGLVSSADNSGSLQLATNNGTTAVTIDTSQNVGVGTTSPTQKLDVVAPNSQIHFGTATTGGGYLMSTVNGQFRISGGAVFNGSNWIAKDTTAGIMGVDGDANIKFFTNTSLTSGNSFTPTEQMRITSAGDLCVGQTSFSQSSSTKGVGIRGSDGLTSISRSGDSLALDMYHTADGQIIRFNNTSSSPVGNINAGSSSTAYNTSSDYRLKENIAPMTGALDKVALLKPVTYKWKLDGSNGQGFIAHELQAVVPDCVTGEKDAVDAEGNPIHQGIDTSFLVATLTAAIQELNAKVEAQAVRIAELEGAK